MELLLGILTIVLPVISSAATYIVGRNKRKNDFLGNLQGSIDLLSVNYSKALNELNSLRGENLELRTLQQELIIQVAGLKKENAGLRAEIAELNERLNNIKIITKTK